MGSVRPSGSPASGLKKRDGKAVETKLPIENAAPKAKVLKRPSALRVDVHAEKADASEKSPEKKAKSADSQPMNLKKPATKGKALLVNSFSKEGWQFCKFKRSTSGTPFNKFTSPDGQIYWTNKAAEEAGFKMEWLKESDS